MFGAKLPKILLFSSLLLIALQAQAIDLSQVKIISAEKLDYKDGNSILVGNVKVKLQDYFITAPRVFIDSGDDGKPFQARFVEDVTLESDDMTIHAPRMVIDLKNTILKCFSSEDEIVETTLVDKNGKKAVILAWQQEFNYQTGFATASAQKILALSENSNSKKLGQVIFVYDKLQIESDDIEMQTADGQVDYVDFIGHAVAIDETQRTEAKEIYFFPKTNIVKAENDVKIAYATKKEPAYIFSDLVIFEKEKNIVSAFSKANEPRTKIYQDEAFGQSRQIVLTLDKDMKPDNAVLTGKAYSQMSDKAVSGHEILFDIKAQKMDTIVGRPKTFLFNSKKKAI